VSLVETTPTPVVTSSVAAPPVAAESIERKPVAAAPVEPAPIEVARVEPAPVVEVPESSAFELGDDLLPPDASQLWVSKGAGPTTDDDLPTTLFECREEPTPVPE